MRRHYYPHHYSTGNSQKVTYGRRVKALLVVLFFGTGVVGAGAIAVAPASASCIGPCLTGIFTSNGLLFVEAGPTTWGFFNPVGQGGQVYAYAITVELYSMVDSNETATLSLYDYGDAATVGTIQVVVPAYSVTWANLTLPTAHSWSEVKLLIDGTPYLLWTETPYFFLSIPGIADGGFDLAIFIAIAVFFVFMIPLSLKGEAMTRRAIYCPKFPAKTWFHGIFAGMLAFYFSDFAFLNSTFQGWEWAVIPIPEAMFFFLWTAGRHSHDDLALVLQGVPVTGDPMEFVADFYHVGETTDGKLIACFPGPIQWWYRSRGHYTVLWERKNDGGPEPMAFHATEGNKLTPEQIAWLRRVPVNPNSVPAKGFRVRMKGDAEKIGVSHIFQVASRDDWNVKPPHMVWRKTLPAHDEVDVNGITVHIKEKTKWTWPHVEVPPAQITLAPSHYQDVWYTNNNWMESEVLVQENSDLRTALWSLRGHLQVVTSRKAEEGQNAKTAIEERPYSDLSPEDLDAGVAQHRREKGLGRKEAESSGA